MKLRKPSSRKTSSLSYAHVSPYATRVKITTLAHQEERLLKHFPAEAHVGRASLQSGMWRRQEDRLRLELLGDVSIT